MIEIYGKCEYCKYRIGIDNCKADFCWDSSAWEMSYECRQDLLNFLERYDDGDKDKGKTDSKG